MTPPMPGRRAAPPLQVWQRRLDHWGERHMMRRAVLKSQAVRRRLRQRRPPRRPRRQRATPEAEAVRRAAKEGRWRGRERICGGSVMWGVEWMEWSGTW